MEKLLSSLIALVFVTACSKNAVPNVTANLRTETKSLSVSSAARIQLESIREEVPANGTQVWLKKDFWLGRTIWVSLGVERASVTGLAMSVDGYHKAKLSRAGSYLVLARDSSGTYGGSVLAPELPLNAYPIVGENDTEILVDLASPKTPYGLTLNNFNSGTFSDTELQPRFEYVRDVQTTESTLSFNTVTTVKSATPFFSMDENTVEAKLRQDPFLLSMTLRTDWVIPSENPGFVKKIADESTLGFFLSPKTSTDNGLGTQQLVQKIATNKPFVWEVSANTPEAYRPAIADAILAWNPSVGAGAPLQVTYGTEVGSITKPNVSNLVWDDNMAVGFAFANWRSNPETGEIVQAELYLSGSMWAAGAKLNYQLRSAEREIREAGGVAARTKPGSPERLSAIAEIIKTRAAIANLARETSKAPRKAGFNKRFFIGLNPSIAASRARGNEFCFRTPQLNQEVAVLDAVDSDLDAILKQLDKDTTPERQPDVAVNEHEAPTHLPYPPAAMDEETYAKNVVRATVMHEIGHTLGLRHNFMGSLGTSKGGEIESASIMDYNDDVVDAEFSEPGSYDQAVIASEYQDKPIVEDLKFCTDEHSSAGVPNCAPFDFSADPVRGQHVAEESNLLLAKFFIQFGQADLGLTLIKRALTTNVQTVRTVLFPAKIGTLLLKDGNFADGQKSAWKSLLLSMSMQDMGWPDDLVRVYRETVLSLLAQMTTPDASGSAAAEDIVKFYKATLTDAQGANSLAARRLAIVGLKGFQSGAARQALSEGLEELLKKVAQPGIASPVDDQEIILALKKILEQDGYYKTGPTKITAL